MMLQDLAPHVFHNEFSHRPAQPEDFLLCFGEKGLLLQVQDKQLRLPRVSQLGSDVPAQFLCTVDARGYYLAEAHGITPPAGFAYVASRDYRDCGPMQTLFACAVGESLHRWYAANRFCGRCGERMEKSETERAMVCPACHHTVYPKICPAVIVAVCDGERLLLTKYAGRAFTRYALVAGFAEIGEPIEDTVRREVAEEVGLHLSDLRFYKSQPWVFTDTLLMGFYAKLAGSDKIRLQEDELSEGCWFDRQSLPDDHSGISLTGEMIEIFRQGRDPFSEENAENAEKEVVCPSFFPSFSL